MRRIPWLRIVAVVLPLLLPGSLSAAGPASRVADLVAREDADALRGLGPQILPELVLLYEAGDVAQRTRIANIFYRLSWKSPEARRALMRDVHTQEVRLRLAVQWALGRVSSDPVVIDTLLHNMTEDPNPLFRDKAACALAHDQVHLTETEKVRIYEGLIEALSDEETQIRSIAIQALRIQTGQTKGFHPIAPPEKRQESIAAWKRWLAEYKENL